MVTSKQKDDKNIEHIRYQPSKSYPFDLEIFSVRDLMERTGKKNIVKTYNYEFFMLLLITTGSCVQIVDFTPVACSPGNILTIKPGQAHNFGSDNCWDGWVILFRPEFLAAKTGASFNTGIDGLSALNYLPQKTELTDEDLLRVTHLVSQMRSDALRRATVEDVNDLLRCQIVLLIKLLFIRQVNEHSLPDTSTGIVNRFRQFQALVEEHYCVWHQVSQYAAKLGYSEKSLNRYSMSVVGLTAKVIISSRINLEAKRLLAHTDMPITAISEDLGFEETTYFTKFFKRETGCTPSMFRHRQQIILWESAAR
ncbi:helix-turn-helix domain-containing protein [Vibrio cholerae]|nr:helix-turn-helix domain-containing protein [Vibrio cholerae]